MYVLASVGLVREDFLDYVGLGLDLWLGIGVSKSIEPFGLGPPGVANPCLSWGDGTAGEQLWRRGTQWGEHRSGRQTMD